MERRGPLLLGGLLAAAIAWKGVYWLECAARQKWHVEVLYSSIFDLSSMAAAFLFAFFTFAKSTDTEFMKKVRKTGKFRLFMGYLVTAMLATAFLAVLSIPLMITTPRPDVRWELVHFFQMFWAFMVGFAVSATWRATRQFVVLAIQDGETGA